MPFWDDVWIQIYLVCFEGWKSKDRNFKKVSWKLEMYDIFIVMQLEKLIITEAV